MTTSDAVVGEAAGDVEIDRDFVARESKDLWWSVVWITLTYALLSNAGRSASTAEGSVSLTLHPSVFVVIALVAVVWGVTRSPRSTRVYRRALLALWAIALGAAVASMLAFFAPNLDDWTPGDNVTFPLPISADIEYTTSD